MKIIIATPRGFCAGVDRAIDTVKLALAVYGAPLYVKHAIVHNKFVVQELAGQGVIFVENVSDIPEKATAIFSAHGSPPGDFIQAKERRLNLIDATCPLVTKVHLEAQRFARDGYKIILVGHKGHIELVGTAGQAPQETIVVQDVKDVKNVTLLADEKVAVLTQTTLSVQDTKKVIAAIKKRWPQAALPPATDICYATTNRQQAVQALAGQTDVILVVGSRTSSNTNRLVEVAMAAGTPAWRLDSAVELNLDWLKSVKSLGITAGASVPEKLVEDLVRRLKEVVKIEAVEILEAVAENMRFTLPLKLKEGAQAKKIGESLIKKHN